MKVNDHYDLVVVGTGFASTFFLHKYLKLTKKPLKILVLEKGQRHNLQWKLDNRSKIQPYGIVSDIEYRDTFLNNNSEKDWVCNLSFGGGSNCWWACAPRFLPSDFRLRTLYGIGRDWPISYDDLERYYCEAEEIMNISGPNDHIAKRSRNFPQSAHTFNNADLILKKAYPDQYFNQPTARASQATAKRSKCCATGVCYLCPVNAKFTIENEMQDLFSDPQVTLSLGSEVKALSLNNANVSEVLYEHEGKELKAFCDLCVLGANPIFNTAILLRSGFIDSELGKGISEQLSLMVKVHLKGLKNFNGSTSVTANGYMLYDTERRREAGACLIESSNIPVLRFEKGRHDEVAVFKLLVEDLPLKENFIKLNTNSDKPEIVFKDFSEYGKAGLKKAQENIEKILSPLPIEKIEFALQTGRSQAHLIGSTIMGSDAKLSIVDPDLVHHKARNLLVLGSGAFPTMSPSNPTLTICALSLRAAERLGI